MYWLVLAGTISVSSERSRIERLNWDAAETEAQPAHVKEALELGSAWVHAKSLQSCPTLCDPVDSSLEGSPANLRATQLSLLVGQLMSSTWSAGNCLKLNLTIDILENEYFITDIVLNCRCLVIIRANWLLVTFLKIYFFSADSASIYCLQLECTISTTQPLKCHVITLEFFGSSSAKYLITIVVLIKLRS